MREQYRRFVSEGKNQPSPWHALQNQVFLGSEAFVAAMQRKIEADADLSEIPKAQRRSLPRPIEYYESRAKERDEAIIAAYASGGYTLKDLGEYFHLHYSRVSRIVAEAKSKT